MRARRTNARPMRCRAWAPRASSPSYRRPAVAEPLAYLRDGRAIYERSFAIIRAEADLSRFSDEEADIAVRMIHACGIVATAEHIVFGGGLVAAARTALVRGAPILGDAGLVVPALTPTRLAGRNA